MSHMAVAGATPLFQELACSCHGNLRTITHHTLGDAKGHGYAVQAIDKALTTLLCSFNDGRVGISVFQNKVVPSLVLVEIGTHTIVGVVVEEKGHLLAKVPCGCSFCSLSIGCDNWGNAWPEDR